MKYYIPGLYLHPLLMHDILSGSKLLSSRAHYSNWCPADWKHMLREVHVTQQDIYSQLVQKDCSSSSIRYLVHLPSLLTILSLVLSMAVFLCKTQVFTGYINQAWYDDHLFSSTHDALCILTPFYQDQLWPSRLDITYILWPEINSHTRLFSCF